GDELENASIINSGAVKANHQRAPAAVKVAGIEGESDAGLLLILPVETAVKYIEAEVAVHDQVAGGGQVGKKSKAAGGLLPDQGCLIDLLVQDQIAEIFERMANLEGLVHVHQRVPDFHRTRRFLFRHQEAQKRDVSVGARRNYVTEQGLNIRFEAPAKLDRRPCQRRIVAQDHMKFAQRLFIFSLHKVKIGGLPSYVWSGGIGLDCVLQSRSLIRGISENLIGAGQIKPIAGRMRIELHRGAIR